MMPNPLEEYDRVEVIAAAPMALSLHWKDGKLVEMRTRWSKSVEETAPLSEHAAQLKTALARYVEGRQPDWPELPFDFSRLTPFQRAAIDVLGETPYGEVRTYGDLAAAMGKPGAARAVGGAMGKNPFPLVYP